MQAVAGAGRLVAGRYRLNGPIGRGAMGIVWHGRDELLDRDVAVKEVQITSLATPADAEIIYQRTLREARTAARLSHPSVVTVFDVVEENGSPWIVMELVRARSLDRLIAEDGPLPPLEAAEIGESLLSALATAHAAGVLHRDVKPSNVLITDDGRTVLTDFGIATFEGDPGLTQVGMVLGTPGFTAPERVRGSQASPASDLWSLGATLYAAVEGRGPFDRPGGSIVIMDGVINEHAPRAPSAGPLAPVIDALLRGDPGTRPDSQTAARLLADAAAQARTGTRPLASARPGRGAGHIPAVASDATTDSRAIVGSGAAGVGSGAAGAAVGAAAEAAAAKAAAGAAAAGAVAPAFMETPAFADLKMPELDVSADYAGQADLSPSGELPAYMDSPRFADPPGLSSADPLGLSSEDGVPWSLAAPASWDPQDSLSLPDSHAQAAAGPRDQAAAGPLDQAAAGPRDQGAASATGSPPPRRGPRGRALAAVVAGVAAVALAAAGIAAWSVHSRPQGTTTALSQPGVQLPGGVTASAHPARHTRRVRHRARPKTGGPGAAPAGKGTTSTAHPAARRSPTPGRKATPGKTAAASPSPSATGSGGTGPGTGGTGTGSGGTPPPAGYQWERVSAASLGSTAGFRIAVPDGWQMTRNGLLTYLDAPSGNPYIEVDVTPFVYPRPLREARYLQAQAKADDLYHLYGLLAIGAATFRGVPDATWRFHWQQPGFGRIGVLEVLFTLTTSAGPQSYALTVSAPAAGFVAARATFLTALQTFKPLP